MPTWLAIAIPSVVAAAAILMWALDYSKKAHEIQKLRLELEKLKREGERSEREERSRSSGLYTPTAAEVDKLGTPVRDANGDSVREIRTGANAAGGDDDGASEAPTVGVLVVAASIIAFLLYGVIRLVIDLVQLFMWLF
jgi:hypothetical protein